MAPSSTNKAAIHPFNKTGWDRIGHLVMARDFNTMWQKARRGERSGLFAAEDIYGMRYSGRHQGKGRIQ